MSKSHMVPDAGGIGPGTGCTIKAFRAKIKGFEERKKMSNLNWKVISDKDLAEKRRKRKAKKQNAKRP